MIKNVKISILITSLDSCHACEVDVECSDSISKPVLPVKYLGKTIYPKGSWTATYFSHA